MGSVTGLSSARISPLTPVDLTITGTGFGVVIQAITFDGDLVGTVKTWTDTQIIVTTPARSRGGIVDFTGGTVAVQIGAVASTTIEYLATREGLVVQSVNRRLAAINAGNGGFYNWSPSKITSFQTDPRTWDKGAGFPRAVSYLTEANQDSNARVARFLTFGWVGRLEAVIPMRTDRDATLEGTCLLSDLVRAVMGDLSNDGLTDDIVVTKKSIERIDSIGTLGSLLGAGIEYVFDLQHIENDPTQNISWTSV